METTESVLIRKGPCESCGSSDACAVYTNGTHCFSCGKHTPNRSKVESTVRDRSLKEFVIQSLPKRKISEETCRLFDYGISGNYQVACYRNKEGEIIAQKLRDKDKNFSFIGQPKKAGLFGQHLWSKGKKIVVTEGEIDCLSVSQAQQNKWPVVSVPNGADGAAKAFKQNLEFLERFDEVVIMFDNDEPGRKGAEEAASVLSPGKAKIAQLPLKDPNEMLVAGRVEELINAIWRAKEYRPDGIVDGKDIWERISDFTGYQSIPYPWEGLNRVTRGLRCGEMVTVVAGSGVGKSEVVRQIAHHIFKTQPTESIGYVALEESIQRTALGFIGLDLNRRVHIDPEKVDKKELKESFDRTLGSGRLFLYDHFGSMEGDHLTSRIRFMVRGLGCKTIVLDHISIVISGTETGDERKAIDVMMTKLRSMVEELQFRLVIISHLRKAGEKPHEEGGRVTLQDLRGSGSIAQLSNIVIAIERNQQSKKRAHYSLVRILKNRFTGETGEAAWLKYDTETGALVEASPPKEDDDVIDRLNEEKDF